jgi:hypothetical protein
VRFPLSIRGRSDGIWDPAFRLLVRSEIAPAFDELRAVTVLFGGPLSSHGTTTDDRSDLVDVTGNANIRERPKDLAEYVAGARSDASSRAGRLTDGASQVILGIG